MTREQAIEELHYIKDSLVSCELSYDALDMAIESLSADVRENVKGEWIDISFGLKNDCFSYTMCGKCHYFPESKQHTAYCPICGTKMVGVRKMESFK